MYLVNTYQISVDDPSHILYIMLRALCDVKCVSKHLRDLLERHNKHDCSNKVSKGTLFERALTRRERIQLKRAIVNHSNLNKSNINGDSEILLGNSL